jgi:hypothetical protein
MTSKKIDGESKKRVTVGFTSTQETRAMHERLVLDLMNAGIRTNRSRVANLGLYALKRMSRAERRKLAKELEDKL